MQDRLHDLHKLRTEEDFNEHELEEVNISVEDDEIPAGLQGFNNEVENLKSVMEGIRTQMETLNSGYRSVLLSTNNTSNEEQIKELEANIERDMKIVGESLKSMNLENKSSTDHTKWRTNIHSLLTKRFMDQLSTYRTMQSDYREKIKERIRQRVLIVNPSATEEDIEKVVDSGNLNVFASQLARQNLVEATEALTFVERRHEELMKIERSVTELFQLFNDMALLVEAQGEFVDNIEQNVSSSVAHVEEANRELASARRKKSRRRWCLCGSCILCLLLFTIAIILLIVFGNAANWWMKK